MSLPPLPFHDSKEGIEQALRDAAAWPVVALDLEAAGLHRYADTACLVQLASGPERALLLDPLAGSEPFGLLGEILACDTPKILHGGDYDVRLLKRDFGFRPANLFDTMIAAQLVGRPQVGLAALLEAEFGIALDKKYQRADWSKRPLTEEMLAYAAKDVLYLPDLHARLSAELDALGRRAWAEEEFRLLEAAEPAPPRAPRAFDTKGASRFTPRQLAVLQALLDLREETARAWDRPPFKVLPADLLLAWSLAPPKGRGGVVSSPGASPKALARLAPAILAAVEEAMALPPDALPRRPEAPARAVPTEASKARLKKLKEARASRAEALGIDPGLLVNTATLEKLSLLPSEETGKALGEFLKKWQREAIGATLETALS